MITYVLHRLQEIAFLQPFYVKWEPPGRGFCGSGEETREYTMSSIQITNLTFSYDGSYDTIFDSVSLRLDTDWKIGFTGRNGRGKTTFLKLLLGKYEYAGSISYESSLRFTYFPFSVEDPTQSAEAAVAAVSPDSALWQLKRECALLSLDEAVLKRPFGTLSPGEQTKLMLAALFLDDRRYLLIDEPTNHLDARARAIVSAYLNTKKGFLLVSHDRCFLDQCVDHILSIHKTKIEIQKGNFSSWWCNQERQTQFEQAENEKLERDIARLSSAAKRTAGWSDRLEKTKYDSKNSGLRPGRGYIGHKSAKMMKRAKSLARRQEAAIAEKAALLKDIERSDSLRIMPLSAPACKLITLSHVSLFYGARPVCENLCLTLNPGDRVAVSGENGSGKSTLLKFLRGEDIRYTGRLYKTPGLRISYVSQDTSALGGTLAAYARMRGLDEGLFKAILNKLDFSKAQFDKDLRDFSAGQKKKVLIAGSLCERAHLYIWDEPLNYIDVISRIQIETLLLSFQPTLLFVEHDPAFRAAIATEVLNIGNARD